MEHTLQEENVILPLEKQRWQGKDGAAQLPQWGGPIPPPPLGAQPDGRQLPDHAGR